MFVQAVLFLSWTVGWAVGQSIDPSTIPLATRDQWCSQQETSCPLICLQLPNGTASTQSNTCDASTLQYSCVCSDGQSPNSTEYSQTIPYFICTAYNTQCQNSCNGQSTCQAACVQDHPCGASEPKRYNVTSTSTSGTATATGTATNTGSGGDIVYTGFGTGSATTGGATSGGSSGIVRPLLSDLGQFFGLFTVVAGVLGGFALLL